MDSRDNYVLTSDPEATAIIGYGRHAAVVFAVTEYSRGVRTLISSLKVTAEQVLVSGDPEDDEAVDEALNFRDRGFFVLANAGGFVNKTHPLRSAAEAYWDGLFPVNENDAEYTFDTVTMDDAARAHTFVESGECENAAQFLLAMTDPSIAHEYALEALRGA